MKEIKYYVSDDESRQSKSQEEIEAFEAKYGTDFETKVSEILKKAIIQILQEKHILLIQSHFHHKQK